MRYLKAHVILDSRLLSSTPHTTANNNKKVQSKINSKMKAARQEGDCNKGSLW